MFANSFKDLAHNAARDRDVRLHKHAEDLVGRLKVSQPDYVLLEIAESLVRSLIILCMSYKLMVKKARCFIRIT